MGKLYTHGELNMPVQVINGKRKGPTLFICAAIHGDELNGVEIIRRLMKVKALQRLKGTLIAVPIVNLHGFINQSRYLPDRRDLNRSFPGSSKGSLASRMAYLFLNEIVGQCSHGIDLHTGAINRTNLPQIRADLETKKPWQWPKLRRALDDERHLTPRLPPRFCGEKRHPHSAVRSGRGLAIRRIRHPCRCQRRAERYETPWHDCAWTRAEKTGEKPGHRTFQLLGACPAQRYFPGIGQGCDRVQKDQTLLGVISDPFGEAEFEVYANASGIVIGQMVMPLVNEGEALFHIAQFARTDIAEERVESFSEEIYGDERLPYDSDDIPSI